MGKGRMGKKEKRGEKLRWVVEGDPAKAFSVIGGPERKREGGYLSVRKHT